MGIRVEVGEDKIPFIQLGDYQMRLDLEELDEQDKIRAAKEINETPENVQYGFSKLRELIEAEEDLNVPLNDESFLIKFLRPHRFNPENAFKVMKRFYKFKIKHPKYGIHITPHSIRHVFDHEVFYFLPTRTPSGARIMVINSGEKWNPKEVKLEDMFKCTMVAVEIAMLEPKTQLGGVHVILDMAGLSINHIYQFSPQIAKLILEWVQDCAPTRLRSIHIINQPYLFNMLYAIFKPFLGEKIKKLLYFHGTERQSLADKISADSLPEYYGGKANIPDFPGSLMADMLFYYQNDFEVFNTYGYAVNKAKSK